MIPRDRTLCHFCQGTARRSMAGDLTAAPVCPCGVELTPDDDNHEQSLTHKHYLWRNNR